jgi:hypothetical protein
MGVLPAKGSLTRAQGVNRDLPLRLEEMVRREVGAVSGGVRAAVAEALPRELAGPAMQVGCFYCGIIPFAAYMP